MQALEADGNPSADPFDRQSHSDVQRLLAGQSSLLDVETLTGLKMQSATTATGTHLFPGLTAYGATAAVGTISHIASIGLGL